MCDTFFRKPIKFNIEGLQSLKVLHLGSKSAELDFSINNLCSLTYLALSVGYTIDQEIITKLLDQVQHIEKLHLHGSISHLNLDNLVNLKALSVQGT